MDIRFGYCVPIFAAPGGLGMRTPNYARLEVDATLDAARAADALGFDSLWVADHLMLGEDDAIMEAWTTVAALAGATRQARLGMIHCCNTMRHASMTAKMAATIDQISGGRLIHFPHPNARDTELSAYGLPLRPEPERVAQMVEALEVILALWTRDGPVDYDGSYYQLREARCRPAPCQQPHPPIWLGMTDEAGFAACARYAQGWNAMPVPVETLRAQLDRLESACTAAGRAMSALELSYETQIMIASDRDGLRRQLQNMLAKGDQEADPALRAFVAGDTDELPSNVTRTFLVGTPDEVEMQIRQYLDLGFSHFLLWFMDAPEREGIEVFAEEVMTRFGGS